MTILTCQFCKKDFRVRAYRAKTAKCCSRKCLWHITKPEREPKRLNKVTGKHAVNFSGKSILCDQCGKEFFISPSREGKKRFCSQTCYALWARVELPFKKYKRITVNGVRILEHRHVMEEFLGRKLGTKEQVHHKNRNKHDNRIENLEVLDIAEHGRISCLDRGNPYSSCTTRT